MARGISSVRESAPAAKGGGRIHGVIEAAINHYAVYGPRPLSLVTGWVYGNAIADAVYGPRAMNNAIRNDDACGIHNKAFQECVKNFGSDIRKCQYYLDMLNQCRSEPGACTFA